MRKNFSGYFREDLDTTKYLWQNATFVFDTNVLLNLYRYSDAAREDFIRFFETVTDRIWLTEQSVYEFLNRRPDVVKQQMEAYTKTLTTIEDIKKSLAGAKGHPFVSQEVHEQLEAAFSAAKLELEDGRKKQEQRIVDDPIQEKLHLIFDGKVGEPFTAEKLKESIEKALQRFEQEIPPGYKDKQKLRDNQKASDLRAACGDYLIWRQLMDFSKGNDRDVIFVTDERKEDWWHVVAGKTVSARPELISEFHTETSKKILFYRPERFMELAEENLSFSLADGTIEEIQSTLATSLTAEEAWSKAKERLWAIDVEPDYETVVKTSLARGQGFHKQKLRGLLDYRPEEDEINKDTSRRAFLFNELLAVEKDMSELYKELAVDDLSIEKRGHLLGRLKRLIKLRESISHRLTF